MSSDDIVRLAWECFEKWCKANADEIDDLSLLERIEYYSADAAWHEAYGRES